MRVLLYCIHFFPSWMLKFIHQDPVMARSHCFLRVLMASCPLNPGILTQGAPSSDYISVLGDHWGFFPTGDSHQVLKATQLLGFFKNVCALIWLLCCLVL